MSTGKTRDGGESDTERGLLHDDHRDGAAAQRAGAGDDEVEGLARSRRPRCR